MALSKEQKILNKFKNVLGLDYDISTDHNLTEQQLKAYPEYQYITVWEDDAYLDYNKVGSPLNESYISNLVESILKKELV